MPVKVAYHVTGRAGTHRRGEVIEVRPGGFDFGRDVEAATAQPDGTISVLVISDAVLSDMRYLKRRHIDPLTPWIITPRPGHPDGDSRQVNKLNNRRFVLDRLLLPADQQSRWQASREIHVTQAEFEVAIRDSEKADAVVLPGDIPRNDV